MKIKKMAVVLLVTIIIIALISLNSYAENNIIKQNNTNSTNNSSNATNDFNNIKNNENTNTNTLNETNNIQNETSENQLKENETKEENVDLPQTQNLEITTKYTQQKAEKTKENGIYKIAVGSNPEKVIEVAGSNKSNNAKIDIWNYYENANAQKFYFEYKDGYYKITAMHTGKSLTVKNNSIKENSEIVQQDYENLEGQKWIIKDSKKNGWLIVSAYNPDLALSIEGTIENGSKIILSKCENTNNQMYYLYNLNNEQKKRDNGIYKISVGKDANKTIQIAEENKNSNAVVNIKNFENLDSQKFYFEYKEGFYKITAMHTGKSLTVKNNNIEEGSQIVQDDYKGLDGQKWIVRDSKVNGWVIESLSNPELALSIEGTIGNGSKIILSKSETTYNQMYYLYNLNSQEKTREEGTYEILVGSSCTKGLEVSGSNKENGAKIGIWEYGNASAQKFDLVYVDGYYKILAKHTGKCLTVKDNNLQEGSQIVQDDYKDLEGQKWLIKDSKKNGWVMVLLNNPNLALSIEGTIENGSKIILSKSETTNNQMFYFIKTVETSKTKESGTYKIAVSAEDSKVIEVAGSSKENNAKVDIWNYGNAKAQKFKFEYMNGFYKITALHTEKSLTVKNNEVRNGVEIVQDEYKGEIGQMWILRDSKVNGWIISPLTRPDLAITVKDKIENGSIIILEGLKNTERQMFYLPKANQGITIDTSKYPGVSETVDKLVESHPNWEFEVLYTGIDFQTAVRSEYEYENKRGNLVYTPTYKGDWIAPNPYVSGNWASASYNAIAYFMDIRNFLNDTDVFQFVDLGNYSASGATLSSIQYEVNKTFLEKYAEDIRKACESTNINPYYVIARLIQEQGAEGSGTINMDSGDNDGKKYFNPFNIGAEVGNDIPTALAYAKNAGWNTMQKGLEGGIKILKSNYIDIKQNTLYLNKFDVNPASGGGFYNHQYMQNLSAAYSEAITFRSAYVNTNTLDNKIKFIIPVYENMPTTVAEKPTGQGENPLTTKGPMNVKVVNTTMGLALRKKPEASGIVIERMQSGTILLSVERESNGWHKVLTPSGNIGYCSNEYLEIISDQTNCSDRVQVQTNDGMGVNVRIGPGKSFDIILSASDGTKGTRILTGKYYYDNFWWDEVVFDDGTKGFVVSDYLKKIN